jgi:hypothetical protein
MDIQGLGLKQHVLLAAVECSSGDIKKKFTMEDLIVCAWRKDKHTWGLRGYEDEFPDSDKLQKEIGRRGVGQPGMVDLGLLQRVGKRIYRLTPAGLAVANTIRPSGTVGQEKADRQLEQAVKQIIEHPVFKEWLTDPTRPKQFRQAGHFWGIAPGTPPKTVRERISFVEQTLKAARDVLNTRGIDEITEQRGRVLFDRKDIERSLEFQKVLKDKFAKDLKLLDPEFVG